MNQRYPIVTQSVNGYVQAPVTTSTQSLVYTQQPGDIGPTWQVLVPTGTVIDFAGSSAPNGYLLCNGTAVSRTTFSALFAVIGTTYGAGDGSHTFNLPNPTFVSFNKYIKI